MLKRAFLKPVYGTKVRKPFDGSHLNPEGETVVVDQYWTRRLAEGSVIEAKPQPKPKPTKQAAGTDKQKAED